MGNEETIELNAMADLLAEIIAFLSKYKRAIPYVTIEISKAKAKKKDSDQKLLKSIADIRSTFDQIKRSRKEEPCEKVLLCHPLLMALDAMIEKQLYKCMENKSGFIDESRFLTFFNGINTEESQKKTHLMILPRWIARWEGSGEDKEVESESYNRFLYHARCVELNGAIASKQYSVNCYYIRNTDAFYTEDEKDKDKDKDKEVPRLKVGMSPMSCLFKLLDRNKKDITSFLAEPWGDEDKKEIQRIVLDTIKEAEREHVNLLVFPEMLGYKGMLRDINHQIKSMALKHLKLIVLPSAWNVIGEKGVNTSCLVQGTYGVEIFSQGKLEPFVDKDKNKVEAIIPDNIINLLYDGIHGCMAIVICRGYLERKIRDLLVNDLGVKLIVCPSWSPKSYSFTRAITSTTDINCNVVWINSCSAVDEKVRTKKNREPISIVTQICKIPGEEKLEPIKFYPDCDEKCKRGECCLFTAYI